MSGNRLINADEYCLITFSTTHAALKAEKVLEKGDLVFLIVPTPREISAGCGLSVRFFCADSEKIIARLKEDKVGVKDVYKIEKGLHKSTVSPLANYDK